jgi:hypothetical protein
VSGTETTDSVQMRSLREQLEQRDERILALELLLVDQASRLLAVEAILANMPELADISAAAVNDRIDSEGKRFLTHFESVAGFIERARSLASQLLQATSTKEVN